MESRQKRFKPLWLNDSEVVVKGPVDLPFLILVILISCVGLIMMFSASYASAFSQEGDSTHWFTRQGLFAIMGVAAMILVSMYDYVRLRTLALPLLVISILLLILVLFIGKEVNGGRRWIDLGLFGFQPSEVAKLGVVVFFAHLMTVYKEKLKTFKYGIVPYVMILALISVLMVLEPHLSGIVLIVATGAVMMFVGGVHWGWFAGAGALAVGGMFFLMTTMAHASKRLEIWRDPFSDPQGAGFQTVQSLYAIGSGGVFGLGLGKSRQKYLYLPEQHNDFVFAIVAEELGWVGAVLVLLLFAVLIVRGYLIAIRARDRFGSLIVTGIMTLFALQVFLNVAVVTNLIPVTGVSMPFFSYGGTSLIIQLVSMGIVLSVSRQIPLKKPG